MQDSVNSNIDCYFEFQYFYMKWLPLASLFFNVIYLAFHCRFWVSSKIIWFCVQCQLFRLFWEAFSRCRELDWVFQCREFHSLSLKLCFSSVSYDGIQDLPQTTAVFIHYLTSCTSVLTFLWQNNYSAQYYLITRNIRQTSWSTPLQFLWTLFQLLHLHILQENQNTDNHPSSFLVI